MGDVIERLKNYCLNHQDLVNTGIIKGINSSDGKVVLEKDGVSKNISIDDLENDLFDFDTFDMKNIQNLDNIETLEEIESLDEQIASTNSQVQENIPITLKDIQDCVISKNESLINKALETFAIDENTGNININKAIKIITDNSIDNVVECIRNNKSLSTNLSDYDLTGKPTISFEDNNANSDINKLIDDSFSNILVYVEVAKLKNINFSETQISNAKTKYATSVNDRLNVLGLNKNQDESDNSSSKQEVKDIKPDTDIKKAGFADILILTIIVLIYAAIIVNLIMKLK